MLHKVNDLNKGNNWFRWRCRLFGHDYAVERLFSPVPGKVSCLRCGYRMDEK